MLGVAEIDTSLRAGRCLAGRCLADRCLAGRCLAGRITPCSS